MKKTEFQRFKSCMKKCESIDRPKTKSEYKAADSNWKKYKAEKRKAGESVADPDRKKRRSRRDDS